MLVRYLQKVGLSLRLRLNDVKIPKSNKDCVVVRTCCAHIQVKSEGGRSCRIFFSSPH